MQLVFLGLAHDAGPAADGTRVCDGFPLSATLVALDLHLLEQSGRKLLSLDTNTPAIARIAGVYVAVFAPRALARRANSLLLDFEIGDASVVEVAEGDRNAEFHVGTVALAAAVEVAASAEEAAEEVEGVVVLAGGATLLVLLYAFVAILVVDAAGFFVDEDLVGLGDGDEFLVGGVVATGGVSGGDEGGNGAAYGFLSGWYFLLRDR